MWLERSVCWSLHDDGFVYGFRSGRDNGCVRAINTNGGMNMVLKRMSLVVLAIGLGLGVAGCSGDDDSAGEALERVVDSVGGGVTDAAEAVGEAAEEVAVAAGEMVDEAEEMVDDAIDATKKAAKDAGDSAKSAMDDVEDSAGEAMDSAKGDLEGAKIDLSKG